MQKGIINALNIDGNYSKLSDLISQVPTSTCVAGLQWLGIKQRNNSLIPVGPIEMAELGGITEAHLSLITKLSVRHACLHAFTEYLDQIIPKSELPDNWIQLLSKENSSVFEHYGS